MDKSRGKLVYHDPTVERSEDAINHVLRVHLPGFSKEDFRVQVDGSRKLSVKGRRALGQGNYVVVEQFFEVPEDSDIGKIRGKFEEGCLTLVMPKKVPSPPTVAPREEKNKEEKTAQRGKPEGALKKEEAPTKEVPKDEGRKAEEKVEAPTKEMPKNDERKADEKVEARTKKDEERKAEEKVEAPTKEMPKNDERQAEEKVEAPTKEMPKNDERKADEKVEARTKKDEERKAEEKVEAPTKEMPNDEERKAEESIKKRSRTAEKIASEHIKEETAKGEDVQQEKPAQEKQTATEINEQKTEKKKEEAPIRKDTVKRQEPNDEVSCKEMMNKKQKWSAALKEKITEVEGWLDCDAIDDLLESINRNRVIIGVAALAFSAGFFVSRKLR